MAIFFCRVKVFSRGRGGRVTRAAAYRAGERIRDERTSQSYNYLNRQGVVHTEITLPPDLANRPDMEWARDRARLWNAVEQHSERRNVRLAREVLVSLPSELTPAQRLDLVRTFSGELAEKYRNAVDFAVHEPRVGSDERAYHAHLLMTAREVTPEGIGPRTTLELGGSDRHARGLGPSMRDLKLIHERWAELTNNALLEAGIHEHLDHRSYMDQGLDSDPTVAMPQKIYYTERNTGRSTAAGDAIRARYRERAEARLKGPEALAQVLRKQKEEARQWAIRAAKEKERLPKKIARAALTRAELNALRRQSYPAKKDVINQKRREKFRELVQVDGQTKTRLQLFNEKRREQLRAMSAEQRERLNEKQRLRYRERAAAKQALALSAAQTPKPSHSPTAEESARNWLAYRQSHGPGPTAEESAKNWLAYRATHGPGPTAEESAKNWLAYRNSQQQQNSSSTASNDRAREHEDSSSKDDESRSNRDLDQDLSL